MGAPSLGRKILKWTLLTLGGLITLALVLVVAAVSIVWFRPQWILTPPRVSKLAGYALVMTDVNGKPVKDAVIPLSLEIQPLDLKSRKFLIELAPGCYSVVESLTPGISFCSERAKLAFTVRLFETKKLLPTLKLVALDHLDFVFASAEIKPQPEKKESEPEADPAKPGPPAWMNYLSESFVWGPIHLEAKEFRMGNDGMIIRGKFSNQTGETRNPLASGGLDSPTLDFDVKVEAKTFKVSATGNVEENGALIKVPSAVAEYSAVLPKNSRATPMKITARLDAQYDLAKSILTANFTADWKNPAEQIAKISAAKSTFRMDPVGMEGKTNLSITLKGKTPAGELPVLALSVGAAMKNATEDNPPVVDLKFDLDSYTFAGITAVSDLEVRMIPRGEKTDLELKRGELKIEVADFRKTVKALSRTSWAIPAPFAVLRGPITLKTAPFRSLPDRVEIPVIVQSNLTSKEQALQLETQAVLALSPKTLAPLRASIDVILQNIRIRLPNYDPLAPVPAFAADPRIIREEAVEKKAEKAAEKAASSGSESDFPVSISIGGKPGSITLLNRYFEPFFSAAANFKITLDSSDSAPTGEVNLSSPMEIHYLNREITLERLKFALRPDFTFSCLVSMQRSGYKITAAVNQAYGKTKITLGSVPALEGDEIVSLLIYGIPKNSISSEQTKSVGSAQSAMSSDALGVFSFFAFASTPIESVRYDSATQTYSAIVRLPGGVVASIGSSWDNDRQVSLSKSIGRNWAVSTEIIRDAEGVDRGGTLLRWRRSY